MPPRTLKIIQYLSFLFLVSLSLTWPVQAEFLAGVKRVVLPNGMRFLLLKRPGAPVFSAHLSVRVGGVDEPDGKTGIAHLLEHMAFKGTTQIGTHDAAAEAKALEKVELLHAEKLKAQDEKAPPEQLAALERRFQEQVKAASRFVEREEFSRIYLRNGATGLNATTSQDLTSYFLTLPRSKLKLWAYLESSRLSDPVFREFYAERDVVMEERRMRVSDSPTGMLYEALLQLAFEKSPYRRPTIGYSEDIQRLSATELKAFYQKYYVPQNMVGAIVGDIDLVETEQVLREYFGKIPATAASVPTPRFQEPEPRQEKSQTVHFSAAPAMMWAYLKPNMPHPDDYAFDVLDQVLCSGPTSRLYRRLVLAEKMLQAIDCSPSVPGSRFPNLFLVYATPKQGQDPQKILQVFDEEIAQLQKGIGEAEIAKAKKNLLAQFYYQMQSQNEIAEGLSSYESLTGSWEYLKNYDAQVAKVNEADLKRLGERYLQKSRRRTVLLAPSEPEK